MGRSMIVGSGGRRSYLVGAGRGSAAPNWQQQLSAHTGAAAASPAGSLSVVETEPDMERVFPIGFVQLAVAGGLTVSIQSKPQVLFRGERLMLEATDTAPNFELMDVKVGKDSQLAAVEFTLFGSGFVNTAIDSRMQLDTAEPGIIITLQVHNFAVGAHDFRGMLFGAVLE
ncbi:MAG: hypothetical protein ACHREM_28875 [Polyangiales bacterium]